VCVASLIFNHWEAAPLWARCYATLGTLVFSLNVHAECQKFDLNMREAYQCWSWPGIMYQCLRKPLLNWATRFRGRREKY